MEETMTDEREPTSAAHVLTGPEPFHEIDVGQLHPRLQADLSSLTLRSDGTPDVESWRRVVAAIDADYRIRDALPVADGSARFENLFRTSPIPMIEQDYTELERWMEGLRTAGVDDIREHIGGNVGMVRRIAPMIRITAANPAAIRAVGLPHSELIGPVDPAIVNEEAFEGWMSQIEAVWQRRPVSRAAFIAATATGRKYDAESVLSAPVMGDAPDFSRALFTIIDVTGHRNEERRMQELVEAKNRFLASVSHEIRTPLTAVLGFAAMLDNEDYDDDEDMRGMISAIATHAQDVADLVEDLLVAARAEMGQVDIAVAELDVMAEIDQTLRAGGSFTTNVTVESDGLPCRALGDAARVRQVVRNLLTNAKKYGGPTITISVQRNEDAVEIAVTDNGPGLPFSEWDRIFEPYHRAHSATGLTESVGIGLAISRQLAELMNGRLEYRYSRGRSIFTLSLDAAV
jgi:signal transduction histidine kinase